MFKQILHNLILLSTFIMLPSTWAQDINTRTILPFASTRLGLEAWSMGGAYVASWNNPMAPLHNPAGAIADGPGVYFEAGRAFSSKYIGFDSDNQFTLPGYVSFSTNVGKLNLSLGYAKSYDFRIEGTPDFPELPPEATEGLAGFKLRTTIETFFSTVSHSVPNKLAVGFTLALNHLNESGELQGEVLSKGSGFGPQVSLGMLYTPVEKLTLGTSFHYAHKIQYDPEFPSSELEEVEPEELEEVEPDPTGLPFAVASNQITTKLPWSIQFGLNYEAISFLNLYAMLDYQKWSSAAVNQEDEIQVHFGAKFHPAARFSFATGFFTINSSEKFYDLNQKFLTFGVQLQAHKTIGLYMTLLDSHLFSDKEPKQTYLGIGLQYSRK